MKKLLLLLALSTFLIPQAHAKLIKVEAASDFSTANPPKTWKVIFVEDVETKTGYVIKAGSVVEGNITNVVSPKKLKRDASFGYEPVYFYDTEGNVYPIQSKVKANYGFRSKLKAKEITKKGALTAGNLVVPGFSYAVQTVEGIYKNEQDNRLKSGATAFVDSTPISLYKKGQEIEFKKGDIFKMNFKINDGGNYEYTTEEDEN